MWASTKEAIVCVAVKTNVIKVSRTFARIRHRRLVAWWGSTFSLYRITRAWFRSLSIPFVAFVIWACENLSSPLFRQVTKLILQQAGKNCLKKAGSPCLDAIFWVTKWQRFPSRPQARQSWKQKCLCHSFGLGSKHSCWANGQCVRTCQKNLHKMLRSLGTRTARLPNPQSVGLSQSSGIPG